MTISNDSRARVKRAFEPIALAMGRVGLTPDGLTLIGFAITVVGAILLGLQQWLIGGLVVFVGGVIPRQDYDALYAAGVKGIFGPGTPIPASAKDVLEQIRKAQAR